NAEVSLPGPSRSVRTREDGTFELHGLREGLYEVRVTPESWDLPWLLPPVAEVRIRDGDTSRVNLRLPGPPAIVASLCGSAVSDTVPGVVLGRVTDATTGRPVAEGGVVVSWGGFDVDPAFRVQTRSSWTSVVSDDDGWYLACGVPKDVLVRARAVPSHGTPEETARRLWLLDVPAPPDARSTRLGPDGLMVRLDLGVRW
ncbi:MAG TPA: carboxypeptidase-like regulatory domain-containing protein, partial [Longimicrobiales bacterium]|nr:carboxypeptidase-like regulatory domain-containing protein [Longimicrobiales bacterium]